MDVLLQKDHEKHIQKVRQVKKSGSVTRFSPFLSDSRDLSLIPSEASADHKFWLKVRIPQTKDVKEDAETPLVGGVNPSEKYEFVSWDDDIPNIWKNKKMFHTTNQIGFRTAFQMRFMFQTTNQTTSQGISRTR